MNLRIIFCIILSAFCLKIQAQINPNPLISVGKPVYSSVTSNMDKLTDGIWKASWGNWSGGSNSWFAVNVGSGPDEVMVVFNNYNYSWSDEISDGGACISSPDYPIEYRFLTSGNSTNGEDGDWEEVVHITDNVCSARMHSFPFSGKSWIKMEIISLSKSTVSVGELEVFDTSNSKEDSWFFVGNSITAGVMKSADLEEDSFESIINQNTNNSNRPAILRGGIPCIGIRNVSNVIDDYFEVASDAKYWAILLGTNDAWGGNSNGAASYKANLQIIIDYLKARGVVPVIGRIPATNTSWQVHPDFLAAIDELIEENDLIGGPDFYSWFLAHPEELRDGVHPNDDGAKSMQRLWAEFALENIYNGDKPLISNVSANPDVINNASNTNLTVSATVTTNTGTIQSVTADLSSLGGGTNVAMTKNGNVYSYTYQVAAGTSAGDKSISITAVNSGNKSRTKMTSVQVVDPGNVYPEISNLSISPGTVYNDESTQITISATVTTALGNLRSVTLNLSSVGGGSGVAMNKNGDVYSYSYTVPSGQSLGSKNIALTAENDQNNRSTKNVALLVRERAGNELIIYNDAESKITGDWVGDQAFSLSEVDEQAYEGTYHLQFHCNITNGWANFGLNLNNWWNDTGYDFSGYGSIQLACKYSGASDVAIQLLDAIKAVAEVDLAGITNQYKVITIPLSDFTGISMDDIGEIRFDFGGVGSEIGDFFIDDIRIIPGSAPVFSVSPASLTLDATQGSQGNITITSNVSWTVSTTASWLSLGATSGTGNGTITVTTTAVNASGADYTAPVTIQSAGLSDLTVSVTQEWDDILRVEPGNDLNIKLYPNPAGSRLHVETLQPADITIMNIQGNAVKRINGVSKMDMDISFLPKGTYIVRLETVENVFIQKIVKK